MGVPLMPVSPSEWLLEPRRGYPVLVCYDPVRPNHLSRSFLILD